jgi:MoaA/NifB/PqqE/SkfB family radical SAM enzyme
MSNEWKDKYNPFNSLKALVHVEYWKKIIEEGVIPPPRFVSIDPCGVCNFKCPHCNANEILHKHHDKMTKPLINKITELLKDWETRAVCIGGGGEPLLNPNYKYLIDSLASLDIETGLVTNGSKLELNDSISKCKWIGISMDAATPSTYASMKGIKDTVFNKVIHNIADVTKKGIEITYKYLLHPMNYKEVYSAITLAKEIGCDIIHIRPGADPWFDRKNNFTFTQDMIDGVSSAIEKGRADFEDESFKIYGITHKFNPNWSIKKTFSKCYACMTNCFIDARGIIGLCCDRRGDSKIELCDIKDAKKIWGSNKHKKLQENIDVKFCPRCTYSNINEIFENVIINDKMMYNLY